MKIKNGYTAVKVKPLIYVFAAVAAIGSILRSIQLFSFIEPETGFYVGSGILMALLYGILFIGCAACCVVSYISKSTEYHYPGSDKDKAVFYGAAAFAVGLVLDSVSSFLSSTASLGITPANGGLKGMMASGFLPDFLQGVFALLSFVYMIIFAFDMKRGTFLAGKYKLLVLSLACWSSVRLIGKFVSQISFLEVSDLFLELVMISFTAMFFMAFAQVSSSVNSTGFSWRLTGLGLPAALIATVLNASRIVVTVIGGADALNSDYRYSLVDITFAAFVVTLVFCLIKGSEKAKEV